MKDIEIAKHLLVEKDYTLVVVRSGQVIFTSKEKGIKPMYKLVKQMKDISKEAAIADKIIGRGAALLSTYLNISEVYGHVMSKEGIDVLKASGIKYSFDTVCDSIKNRDKTGLCPIEKLSLGIKDPKIFLSKLDKFFK